MFLLLAAFVSALTGILLLGWSGGGVVGVGGPYLFQTIAAVVVGGTSLLGGKGGYGFTVIGVLVLQVLSSFLVGIGLSYEGQTICIWIVDSSNGGFICEIAAYTDPNLDRD